MSEPERRRAEGFRSTAHGHTFAASRSALRHVLAAYTGGHPAALVIAADDRGKPFLQDHPWLQFNLSHSGSLALYAVARDRLVGVDVERIRPLDHEAIARRFFTAAESAGLGWLPDASREAAFFACWARKEAYLKAIGGGVASGLATFDVEVDPVRVPRILRVDDDPAEADRWWMGVLDPAPGHAGAVVVARPVTSLDLYDFPPGG